MAWKVPPPEVQQRVSDVLGEGFWADFKASLDRVKLRDPEVNVTSWYRDPAAILRVRRESGGALYTQHGVGIAQDILASSLAARARLAAAGRAEGFSVRAGPPDYAPTDLHVHLAALTDANWRRSPLRRQLERLMRSPASVSAIFSPRE